jgi:hypothetical protein
MVVVSFSVASQFLHVPVIFAHVAMIPSCSHLLFFSLYELLQIGHWLQVLPSLSIDRSMYYFYSMFIFVIVSFMVVWNGRTGT